MYNKSVLVVLALVAALPSTPVVWAKTPSEIQNDINTVLGFRHPPSDPGWWVKLGPQAPAVITGMYQQTTDAFRKVKLLEGLGWFPGDVEAARFLEQQANEADNETVRLAAIKSLGSSQGEKEFDFLSKFLKASSPRLRLAAAEQLQSFDDPRAKKALEDFSRSEKVQWVVDRLNGETRKSGKLMPVSSSDDRVFNDLPGVWKGYWIYPKQAKGGVQVEAATLQLTKPQAGGAAQTAANALRGELKLRTESEPVSRERTVPVSVARTGFGNLSSFMASVNESSKLRAGSGKPDQTVTLWLRLQQPEASGPPILQMEVPSIGGILYLQKEVSVF